MRAWVDGVLLPDPAAPAVTVSDHGFTVGDGVFEAVKVVQGRPVSPAQQQGGFGRRVAQ